MAMTGGLAGASPWMNRGGKDRGERRERERERERERMV